MLWKIVCLTATLHQPQRTALQSAGFAAPKDSLREIVARYELWRGSALKDLEALRERGELRTGGLSGRVDRVVTRDGRYAESQTFADFRTAEAAAGSVAWRTNLSGQTEAMSAAAALDRRHEAQLLFDGFLSQFDAPPALLPADTLDGTKWSVVRVRVPDSSAFDFFIDPASGRLDAVRIREDRRTRIVRYADWRMVKGVRLPFRESVSSSNESSDEVRRYETVQLDPALTPAAFARPPDILRPVFVADDDAAPWVPFDLVRGNKIYVPAAINGHKEDMLLDSGAETTVIDADLATRDHLAGIGHVGVEGSGGSTSAGIVGGISLSVGGMTLRGVTATVMDLAGISHALAIPLPAILGQEVFFASIVDIDFPHRRIAFRRQDFVPPANAVRLPLRPAGGNRVLDISVEGRAAIPVVFDLGNGSPLDLFPAYWGPQRLLDGRRNSLRLNGGAGGSRPVHVASLRRVSIGGFDFSDVPTNLPDPSPTTQNSERVLGNLGLPILSRFRVITDYRHDCLYLVPTDARIDDAFSRDRSGLSVTERNDTLEVTFVSPDSPAAAGGWKIGDRIIAIDGAAVGPTYQNSDLAFWSTRAAGTDVALTLAGGVVRHLTLADYYVP